MPYIKRERRDEVDPTEPKISAIFHQQAENVGELNFQITRLCIDYVKRKGLCYDTVNAVRGVLGCVTDEFYRRMAAPYEDTKIKENGDVYPSA
jgi:hypothetical protein